MGIRTVEIARIDRDYIAEPDDDSRVGQTWSAYEGTRFTLGEKRRFRCKDDDGEVYYGGWLLDDPDSYNQFMVLEWCQVDAGCTTIEVFINGKWVQDIG